MEYQDSPTDKLQPRPDRLIPHHMRKNEGPERQELVHAIAEARGPMLLGETASEYFRRTSLDVEPLVAEYRTAREIEMMDAPDLDDAIRESAEQKGKELDPRLKMGLEYIKWLKRTVKTCQDLRKIIKASEDPGEISKAAISYAGFKKLMDQGFDEYGPSIEKAYREYIRGKLAFVKFKGVMDKWEVLERTMNDPEYSSEVMDRVLDDQARARVEASAQVKMDPADQEEMLATLRTIYPEESEEYQKLKAQIEEVQDSGDLPRTKAERQEEIEALIREAEELWEDPMVKHFWSTEKYFEYIKAINEGEDVLETPSVIRVLNKLADIQASQQRSTVGGVLVGPPGVGKTTIARHFIERKGDRGRRYVYLDFSEDITRYMLFGSKSIDFKSSTDYFKALRENLAGLDEDEFKAFIDENAQTVMQTFNGSRDEAVVTLLAQIQEDLLRGEAESGEADVYNELRARVEGMASQAFRRELGEEFAHIVKKNGWRDGIVIAALRRDEDIIIDEFNKTSNLAFMHSLLTAKPGEEWVFGDNDERIMIPKNWRMYFTANIGSKHNVKAITDAFASRGAGAIIKVDYPPPQEEMDVAVATISNPAGDILLNEDDLAKLLHTISVFIPAIRSRQDQSTLSVSYRTLRVLGEKLIQYKDPKTGAGIYRRSTMSFDKALYSVLVDAYSLYEGNKIPSEIVQLGFQKGLFLDPELNDELLGLGIDQVDIDEAREVFNDPEKKKELRKALSSYTGRPEAPETAQDVMSMRLR